MRRRTSRHQMPLSTRRLLYGLLVVTFILGACDVFAQHGSWHDRYTNESGMRCCGPTDCRAVPVSIVAHDGIQVTALVMGILIVLPALAIHQSEDQQSWFCSRYPDEKPSSENVRCLFYVVGS